MNDLEARLDHIRGAAAPRNHNARTIAALTSNPGCARRAIMDAAGVDKQLLASHMGFPTQFGQSQFAIGRGNAFEAQVKAGGCAELLRLLREHLELCPFPRCPTTISTRSAETPAARYGTPGPALCLPAPPDPARTPGRSSTTRCSGCKSAVGRSIWNLT